MRFAEQVANDVRLLLPTVKMRSHSADELGLVGRTALAQRVGIDILVEQLVGLSSGQYPGRITRHSRSLWRATKSRTAALRCTGWPSTMRTTLVGLCLMALR